IGLLVFELIYFMGYSGVLLEKKSELSGYYSIVEKIDTLPAGIVVGVDSCVIDSNNYLVPFIYKSFIDNPDPSGPNICRLTETTRALQFWWADYNYNNGRFRIYDSFGKEVLLIGEEVNLNLPNIDYFLTACKMLADPIVFEEGKLKLYKVR
ncbi:MAG: hypothetical protein NTY48_04240, partial [Candidatus Diapherotrites archaeon]|nr:hypothetical protein [Candidatus Diapherotrites archaeon]